MNLSIIIPTLNSTGDKEQDNKIDYSLTQCLNSLNETVPDIPIVVASNGIGRKHIPTQWNNVTRIDIEEQGQCRAVNAAVATTNTEWIMVSNDDMVYPPGWLQRVKDNLKHNELDIISAKLVEPNDGAPTFIKYFCGGAGGDFDRNKFFEYASLSTNSWYVDNGFNLPFIIKRELWDLIGGYDINYDPWGSNSDSDLEYKIKLTGVQPKQSRKWKVYHFSQTSGTFNPKNGEYWQRNFKYFEDKWGFPRTDEGIWTADFDIPLDKLKYKPSWMKV